VSVAHVVIDYLTRNDVISMMGENSWLHLATDAGGQRSALPIRRRR